jgi:predicted outer membrane protein
MLFSCYKNDDPNLLNKTDKEFLLRTYLQSRMEIEAGQLALGRGHHPSVYQFAQKLITHYTATREDVMTVAQEIGYNLSDTASLQLLNTSGLELIAGSSFDTAYLNSCISSHHEILNSFQKEFNEGNNTYVRYYLINRHIDKVKEYLVEADSLSRTL